MWAVIPCANGIQTQGPPLAAHPLTHPLVSLPSAAGRLWSWRSESKGWTGRQLQWVQGGDQGLLCRAATACHEVKSHRHALWTGVSAPRELIG